MLRYNRRPVDATASGGAIATEVADVARYRTRGGTITSSTARNRGESARSRWYAKASRSVRSPPRTASARRWPPATSCPCQDCDAAVGLDGLLDGLCGGHLHDGVRLDARRAQRALDELAAR